MVCWINGNGLGEFLPVLKLAIFDLVILAEVEMRCMENDLALTDVRPGPTGKTYTASSKFFSAIALFPKALSSSALMMDRVYGIEKDVSVL